MTELDDGMRLSDLVATTFACTRGVDRILSAAIGKRNPNRLSIQETRGDNR